MNKLISNNGSTNSYDAIGNPTGDGTWTYTWEKGRQLKKMSKTGTTAEFKYNADGLRVQKKVTVSGTATTTNYILHGKNIVHMTRGSTALHFWYDAQNRPAIVLYGSTRYAYVHNLQGDIVGIIDNTGTEVVKYTYDAWGKVLSTTGSLASTLGTIQPFRYRGYVYDVETGLYYLRSRYYNPTWGRFINADAFLMNNPYCYCSNNSVNRIDTNGTDDFSIQETSKEGIKTIILLFKSVYEELLQRPAPYYLFNEGTAYKAVYSKHTEYIKSSDEKIEEVNTFISDSVDIISELAGRSASAIGMLWGMYIPPETVSNFVNCTLSFQTTVLDYQFDHGIVRKNAGHNHTTYSLTVYDSVGFNKHSATISITFCNGNIHDVQSIQSENLAWQDAWQDFINSIFH